ncbi:MAG: GAF domain-containing protein [Verrucomicrobiota bacterium]
MSELKELQRRYERLQLLYQVGSVIHSTLEPKPALAIIAREAARLMDASSCSVVLINPTTGLLEIEAAQGLPGAAEGLKLRVGEGLTGWVAQTGKPACVGDVTKDRRYIMLRPEVRSELARAARGWRQGARRVERGFGPAGCVHRGRSGFA